MKRALVVMIAILLPVTAFAAPGIQNSEHNFSTQAWNTSGEICVVCHTPHNADTSVAESPLWNHQVTAVTNYTVYSSPTLTATVGQPKGISKLCLSCHDGTVALDNYGGRTTGTNFISGDANFGTNLSNDHPISFNYDDTLATSDGGLYIPSSTNSGLGGTIKNDMLFTDSLECASCHDVHNSAGIDKLLLKSNAGSALCLTCHNK